MKQDINNVSLLTLEEKQKLYGYIDTLPEGDCICHFDFHPDNIMISNKKYYVIDWMSGCIGDPLSDVARTALILNYGEIPRFPNIINKLVKKIQRKVYQIYLDEYVSLTGATNLDIQKWELPLAAARLCEWISESESKILLDLVKKSLNRM